MAAGVRERTVEARGLGFRVLEQGDGPLVLCLHGFPDTAHSFRHLLPVLAGRGMHAVAPFMRGYAPTGAAPDGCYHAAALGLDALALIEALGHREAVIIGHDWGALATYAAALVAPDRVRKLVTLALPYGPQLLTAFATDYDQQRRSWYMFFFQTPFAEGAVAHADFAFIERLWRDWSPGWTPAPDGIAAAKDCLRQPGVVEAALAYYRAAFGPPPQDPALAEIQGRLMMAPIDVPGLYLHGVADGCLGVDLVEGMASFFPRGLRVERIEGAGHFLHLERPELVQQLIDEFLAS